MGSSKKHKKHREKDKERDKRAIDESSSTSFTDQKPLRLVLKVGSASTTVDRSPSISSVPQYQEQQPEESSFYNESKSASEFGSSKKLKKSKKSKKKHKKHHHHHRHHHKHKSTCSHHSKSRDVSNDSIDSSKLLSTSTAMDVEPLASQDTSLVMAPVTPVVTETPNDQNVQPIDPIMISPPKSPQKVSYKSSAKPIYHNLFTYILRQIEKRDTNLFFAWPVTDYIAPGYSTIIKNPMDLYTIRKKIEQRAYETIAEMKSDVKLMCDNAMTYNQPDTIYYKTARKIWHYARDKVFTRENINDARTQATASNELLPSMNQGEPPLQSRVAVLTDANALGDITNTATGPETAGQVESMDTETDDEEAAAILAQAEKAAAAAAQRLSYARPQGAHFSFLRQQEDGSTTLAIVGSTHAERTLSINDLVGKLPEGTPYLPSYNEPESNKVHPVESVSTLPFSSHLPSLDSSRSKLTQEESSLLLATYGDEEIGIPYAQSLLEFAGDSGYLIKMVDNLLEILTQGQHSKVLNHLKSQQEENEKKNDSGTSDNSTPSTNGKEVAHDDIDAKLEETHTLISSLEAMQRKRLSSTTKPTPPSNDEVELASTLSSKLAQMIGTCTAPIDVTDIKSIRKAMGVHVKDS